MNEEDCIFPDCLIAAGVGSGCEHSCPFDKKMRNYPLTRKSPTLEDFGFNTQELLIETNRDTMKMLIAAEKEIKRLKSLLNTKRLSDIIGPIWMSSPHEQNALDITIQLIQENE